MSFDKYMVKLIEAGVPQDQLVVQYGQYHSKDHLLRQDLTKNVLKNKEFLLPAIKERSVEVSGSSINVTEKS